MKARIYLAILMAAFAALFALGGCASGGLSNGVYQVEVDTDSNMFHAESCALSVEDGTYTASLTLPGEGFSRLYFGTIEEAESAPDSEIYDYRLNDDGKYTFDIPVSALDEELEIAAWGQRRDRWYQHTITFPTPTSDQLVGELDKAA